MTSSGTGGDIERANTCHRVWESLTSHIPRKIYYIFLKTKGNVCINFVPMKKEVRTVQAGIPTKLSDLAEVWWTNHQPVFHPESSYCFQDIHKRLFKQANTTPLLSYKAIYEHNIPAKPCAFSWKFLGVTKFECSCLDEWDATGAKADSFISWGGKKAKKCKFSFIWERLWNLRQNLGQKSEIVNFLHIAEYSRNRIFPVISEISECFHFDSIGFYYTK